MICPISGLECVQAEARLADGGRLVYYQCIQYGAAQFVLLSAAAMERWEAERKRAQAIIAAARGSEEYGIGG